MKHTEQKVIEQLKKKGITVSLQNKTINIAGMHDAGNGTWGKLDFLINHKNYILIKDNDNVISLNNEQDKDIELDIVSTKQLKRETKINLSKNIKEIMRKWK